MICFYCGFDFFFFFVSKEILPLSDSMLCNSSFQIITAIEFLHSHGIVHRDLKLENVVVMEQAGDIVLKLIDLGFSEYFDLSGQTLLQDFCGSPDYAAPELLHRNPYGPLVDVWAFGVMLFVMAAGEFPFSTPDLIIRMKYCWPSQVHVSDLVKKIISNVFVNSDIRCSSQELLKSDWFAGTREERSETIQHQQEIDGNIITSMADFGFDKEEVTHAVLSAAHNQISTTYYLLKSKAE